MDITGQQIAMWSTLPDLRNIGETVNQIDNALHQLVHSSPEIFLTEFPSKTENMSKDLKIMLVDYRISFIFKNILWSSLFLSCFSILEAMLDALCDHYRISKKLTLKPDDLREKGIVRSQKYLTAVARVPFPTSSIYWNSILKTRLIRNCLTHVNGVVDQTENSRSLLIYVRQHPKLVRINNGRLFVSKELPIAFSQWGVKLSDFLSKNN
jgi:hypothetical protein